MGDAGRRPASGPWRRRGRGASRRASRSEAEGSPKGLARPRNASAPKGAQRAASKRAVEVFAARLDGPRAVAVPFALVSPMLSDRDAEEIERGRRQKVGGPVVLKWLDQLLQDRRERIQQLEHLRRRLRQAFRYLDGLVGEARQAQQVNPRDLACPKCGRPYERAVGRSPDGITYFHPSGERCTT